MRGNPSHTGQPGHLPECEARDKGGSRTKCTETSEEIRRKDEGRGGERALRITLPEALAGSRAQFAGEGVPWILFTPVAVGMQRTRRLGQAGGSGRLSEPARSPPPRPPQGCPSRSGGVAASSPGRLGRGRPKPGGTEAAAAPRALERGSSWGPGRSSHPSASPPPPQRPGPPSDHWRSPSLSSLPSLPPSELNCSSSFLPQSQRQFLSVGPGKGSRR